jgi:hypothetical protein
LTSLSWKLIEEVNPLNLFPDHYLIRIIEKETQKPISDIVMRVTLFASQKNNYHFIPALSDENGMVQFSKTWIESEIDKMMNLFIMDYSSGLEDCSPEIEIEVMGVEDIKKAAEVMNTFKKYFHYSKAEIEKISMADNFKYKPVSKRIVVTGAQTIYLTLEL